MGNENATATPLYESDLTELTLLARGKVRA